MRCSKVFCSSTLEMSQTPPTLFSALPAMRALQEMGTQVANYDLQVDLQNLWAESLNSIAAMLDHSDVKVPEVYYSREDDHFEVIEEEEAATATTTTTANAKK